MVFELLATRQKPSQTHIWNAQRQLKLFSACEYLLASRSLIFLGYEDYYLGHLLSVGKQEGVTSVMNFILAIHFFFSMSISKQTII